MVSLSMFPADGPAGLKLWVGEEGRDNGRKKEGQEALKNSTAEQTNYSASSPGPENPVGRKLDIPSLPAGPRVLAHVVRAFFV